MEYYVYVHRKKTDGTIFYVGKGCGKRAWSKARSVHWKRVVQKHGFTVEIIHSGLQEWYAFELEKEMILRIGRLNDKTGPLVNHSEGGCGGYNSSSKEVSTKISEALKNRSKTNEHRENLRLGVLRYNSIHGTHPRKPHSEESKLKISKAKIGTKTEGENPFAKKIRCIQTGEIFNSLKSAEKWMISIGFCKASSNTIGLVLKGIFKQYHGYSWEYVKD